MRATHYKHPTAESVNCYNFFFGFLILEEATDKFSGNVGKELPIICRVISQKSADLIH
jgi:hypothetical protein